MKERRNQSKKHNVEELMINGKVETNPDLISNEINSYFSTISHVQGKIMITHSSIIDIEFNYTILYNLAMISYENHEPHKIDVSTFAF